MTCLSALETLVTRGQVGQIESVVADVVGYIVVQSGQIVLANDTARQLLEDTDLIGKPLKNFLPEFVAVRHDEWVQSWRDAGAPAREMGTQLGRRGLRFTLTIASVTWNCNDAELAVMLPNK